MKAVDPRVKVGIVGTYGEHSWPQRTTVINPVSGLPASGWSAVVLTRMREAGVLPDYFDFHLAPTAPGKESDAASFQALDRIDFWTERMRKMLRDYLGTAASTIPLNLTESKSGWARLGKQSTSLTNALYLAYSWGQLAVRNADSSSGGSFTTGPSPTATSIRAFTDGGRTATSGFLPEGSRSTSHRH